MVSSKVVEGKREREEMAVGKRWRRNPNSREPPPHRECPLQSDSNAKLSRNYNLFSFHGLLSPL